MIAYENRKHKGVGSSRKLELMLALMHSKKLVKTGSIAYGNVVPDGDRGKIEQVVPGVWGYGGDAIAVYVNGQPYPASAILELNVKN